DHSYLLSFPTRRSSDLGVVAARVVDLGDGRDERARHREVAAVVPVLVEVGKGRTLLRVIVRSRAGSGCRGVPVQVGRNAAVRRRSEEHTSELQSRENLV